MEERTGGYRVSSMLRSALANPDFCSALEDVLAFARGRYETYYMSDEGLVVGRKYTYEDRFVDPSTLVAISKSKRTLDSADVMTAADSERLGVRMFLFVRKNKDDKESKEFYYLGRIRHEAGGVLKQFVMPNTDVSAVEIEYKLETPVEKNLYDYLTSENV